MTADSLLSWMQRLINVRRECPENGDGTLTLVDGEGVPPEVLVHRVDGLDGSLLFLHNLCDDERTVATSPRPRAWTTPERCRSCSPTPAPRLSTTRRRVWARSTLSGYGYRWIRLV